MKQIQLEVILFLSALLLVLVNWILLGKALFLKLCALYVLLRVAWSYRLQITAFFRRFSPVARIRRLFVATAA